MWIAIALSAVSGLSAVACVFFALACWRALKAASNRASTTSLRAEIDEMRDAFEKNSALLKRINQRHVMQERRAADGGADSGGSGGELAQRPGESGAEWKARVRKRVVGLKHG